MILESLLELVETLKVRIDEHGEQLRGSEALTRYVLVDPLLRELGWNTEDPSLVIPEYQSGNGRADYALFDHETPVMMVEAKKLGTQLRDAVLSQGINYCLMEGTNFFTVTDGQRWEVYETHRAVPIDQKRVVEFDLKDPSPATVCLKALALWRPSVQSGFVAPGHEPVLESTDEVGTPVTQETPDPVIPSTAVDDHEWQSLTEIDRAGKGVTPVELRFPNGNKIPVENWATVPIETVRWLMDNGMLKASHCPILSNHSSNSRFCVHTQNVHKDGVPFKDPVEVNGLYVDKVPNGPAAFGRTKTIIEYVGQNPANFRVRVS